MLATVLRFKFPNAKTSPFGEDYLVQDDGSGPYIKFWNEIKMGRSKPDDEQINIWAAELASAPRPADEIRDEALLADVDRKEIYDAIRNATPVQIKSYISNQVTDLASAKIMLIKLALLVAIGVKK